MRTAAIVLSKIVPDKIVVGKIVFGKRRNWSAFSSAMRRLEC
jgi:hypothetical protein